PENAYIRLVEQLGGEHLLIANVQVLLTPVPDLASSNLPFGGAGSKRRDTGPPRELAPHCQHVCITSRETQLSNIDRQAEGDIEGKLILQQIAVALNLEHCLIETCDCSGLELVGLRLAAQVV